MLLQAAVTFQRLVQCSAINGGLFRFVVYRLDNILANSVLDRLHCTYIERIKYKCHQETVTVALNSRRCDQHELQELTDMQEKKQRKRLGGSLLRVKGKKKTKNKHSSAHGHDKKLRGQKLSWRKVNSGSTLLF